ncbi:aldo/keto reductase [Dokdonella sp.]|uniref:aldo/keto reductase n=1 Tax=Dokdonella sp. TaxID=2291710 RepID=UPI0025C50EA9|nr:aldo/keto reductase [Dokdonella sp.]MBX3693329.1 aldo/keto reductase [Dokdonella sp.]MCW5568021.1 aldo/keto reductase [Dokdonella sp.]
MLNRRQFLATGLTAAGISLVASRGLLAASPSPMLTRPIPSTGERIPVIGAGTSGSFEAIPGSGKYEQLKDVLKVFFEGGGSVIDTSPNYSGADEVLGTLLADGGWRAKTFLATKIAADSRADAEAQWAGSLRRLRTDKVELLQVHNLREWKTQLPYARELKEQGKTRYVGITHYVDRGLPELEQLMRNEKLDFIQIHYSVNAANAAKTVLPLAQDKGIAVLVNRAFDDGRLFARVKERPLPGWAAEIGVTSWSQMFLKFAISHPAVTAVIPATSKPERQADQLKAGHGPLLSSAWQRELVDTFAS